MLEHHLVRDRFAEVEGAIEIRRKHFFPGLRFHADEQAVFNHASVINQNIDAAPIRQHPGHNAARRLRISDITLPCLRSATEFGDFSFEFRRSGLIAPVNERDLRSLLGQREDNGFANSTTATRYDRHLIAEHDVASPFVVKNRVHHRNLLTLAIRPLAVPSGLSGECEAVRPR